VNWRQPICTECWETRNPGRIPVRLRSRPWTVEQCSFCGHRTGAGIFVRAHPDSVPFPAADDPDGSDPKPYVVITAPPDEAGT
jgi:hypothetical protein